MKKLIVMASLFVLSMNIAYSGYQSTSITSTCFWSCKTTVEINGVERVFEGVKSAKVLEGTGYLIIDGDKFLKWPDGEILDAIQFEAQCPTCASTYNDKENIAPEVKNFCRENFSGTEEGRCETMLKDYLNLDEAQVVVNKCDDIFMLDSKSLICLENVLSGELDKKTLTDCSENKTFSSEKKECLLK
jgi:hypothetical protein